MQSDIIYEGKRKIARSGNTSAIYIPSEGKEYFAPGNEVDVVLLFDNGKIKIEVTKQLFKFNLDNIRALANENGFSVEFDKRLEDAVMFNAVREDGLSISYTRSLRDKMAPAYVTVSRKFQKLNHMSYKKLAGEAADGLRKKFDVIIRPEGNLDTINLLKEPEWYKLNLDNALGLLERSDKELGLSIVVRFDNVKNGLDKVKEALYRLSKLKA